MAAVESTNVGGEFRCAVRGLQSGVALSASAIGGAGQPKRALMLDMATRACRSKRLVCLMDGPIVASQAGLVGGAVSVARLRDMARAAFLSQQRMSMSQRTCVVRRRTSRHGMP